MRSNIFLPLFKRFANFYLQFALFDIYKVLIQCVFQKLDYQWYHTATVEVEGDIVVLAWNLEGSSCVATFSIRVKLKCQTGLLHCLEHRVVQLQLCLSFAFF